MPNGDDTTTVNLKDGTVLHLKGKGLSPEQVSAKVSAFRASQAPKPTPESERPDTAKQAQEAVRRPLDELQEKRYSIFTPTGISGTPEQLKEVESAQKNVAIGAGSMVGGEAVGALVPGAEAAAGSSKFLKFLLPMLARSSGVGAGAGGTALLTGSSPKEALATASQFSALEAGGETGAKVVSKVAKPVGRFVKDLTKSDVKVAEEAHAAKAIEIEKTHQKALEAHQEEVAKIEKAHQKKLADHAEREQRIEQRYQKRVTEHQAKTQELDLEYQKKLAEHQEKVKAVEEDYQKRLAEHKQKVTQVKQDYAEQVREFQEKSKDVSKQESLAEAKKGAAVQHQNELAGLLKQNLELADEKIGAELGKQFDDIHSAVEAKSPKIDVRPVIRAAETAKKSLLFEDSKKAFDQVLATIQPEGGTVNAAQYGDIRQAYSKLNEYLYGGGEIPSDLYRAVKAVRDSLGEVSQNAADSVGLGGKFKKVMSDWSEYKSTFHDKSAIAKGGSPIRRILDAEDPAFVIDQLKGKAGERLVEEIGQYSKYGADKSLAGRLKSFINKVSEFPSSAPGMPKSPERPAFPKTPERGAAPKVPERSAAPKEPEAPYKPKPPERKDLPKAPEKAEQAPFDREAVARQQLIKRIRAIGGLTGSAAGGALLYHLLFGKDSSKEAPLP